MIESFESPNGKFANSYGNVMVVDSKNIMKTLISSIRNNIAAADNTGVMAFVLQDAIVNFDTIENVRIEDYAFEIDGVLKNREQYYLGTPNDNEENLLNVQRNLDLKMNVSATTPVSTAIEGFFFVTLFLNSTFSTIVFFMALLSVMLIHSLMISDVEEKTYEMGMLRALGLRTVSLVQLIIIQSLVFALPGVLIGVIVSVLLNVIVRYIVFKMSFAYTTYMIAGSAAALGICLGGIMPLLSNIWAIKRALGKKIRDSLDVFHTGINDVMVKVVKLSNWGLSPFELSLGITLVVMGVLTYYLAPAAFIFNRLDIFFFILNIILVGMIVGLTFL